MLAAVSHGKAMKQALHRIVGSDLKQHGFRGAMPHYRRVLSGRTDVVSFTFSRFANSFCVSVATFPTTDIAAKVDALDGTRLGNVLYPEGVDGHWFEFADDESGDELNAAFVDSLAYDALAFIYRDGFEFWERSRG